MHIEYGSTRMVFIFKKVVVKIPRFYSYVTFLNGLLANLQERLFWKEFNSPYLAKIYVSSCFGFFIIMEKADVICSVNDYEIDVFFDKCLQKGLPVDKKYTNVGVFNGELKLTDYGD